MLHDMNYKFSADAREAFIRYIAVRMTQPLFSNARSIRNALDRMRLRQANRLVADLDRVLTPTTSCRWRRRTCSPAGCSGQTSLEASCA